MRIRMSIAVLVPLLVQQPPRDPQLSPARAARLRLPGGYWPGPNTRETIAYGNTFYPGVRQAQDAERVSVGLGQEILNLDLTMPLARAATLSGRVIRTDGHAIY